MPITSCGREVARAQATTGSEEKAHTAKARIGKSLSRSVDKGRMTAEAAARTLDLITAAGSYESFADV
ncbi:MAG: hypothetical protein JF598_28970, partial [Streptomyces sp.]|nr:hypothetical protein [Streptomyces sp.]